MASDRFCRYLLRTTDPAGARAFYTEMLGADFWGPQVSVAPLPERILALGGRPHWLGQVGTPAVEDAVAKLVAAGAQRLGPTTSGDQSLSVVVLRDPFGALLGVIPDAPAPGPTPVAWHLLHVADEARAFALYGAIFGWAPTEHQDRGPELGVHQMFAWEAEGKAVGSVATIARSPQIHPQWLFFFPVANLDAAIRRVRNRGGLALDPVETSRGDRVVPCDDPQGAAFGLFQAASAR